MEQQHRPNFEQMMRLMSQLYRQKLSPETINLYWYFLKRYAWPAVQWAFKYHVQSPEFGCWMPKPADIIRYLEGDNQSKTLKAWAQVQSALRTVGSYGAMPFTDRYIRAVIQDMGGWYWLCQTRTDQLRQLQREFEQRYQRYLMFPPAEIKQSLISHGDQS